MNWEQTVVFPPPLTLFHVGSSITVSSLSDLFVFSVVSGEEQPPSGYLNEVSYGLCIFDGRTGDYSISPSIYSESKVLSELSEKVVLSHGIL